MWTSAEQQDNASPEFELSEDMSGGAAGTIGTTAVC